MKKIVIITLLILFVCFGCLFYKRSTPHVISQEVSKNYQIADSYLNSLQQAFVYAILAKSDQEQAINVFENAIYEKIKSENIPFTRQAFKILLPFYKTKMRQLDPKNMDSIVYELGNMHSAGELLAHLYWIDEVYGKNAGIVIRKPTAQDNVDEQPNTPEDIEVRTHMSAKLEAEIEALRKTGADVNELLNMPMSGVPDFYEVVDENDTGEKKLFFKDYHVPHHDQEGIAKAAEGIGSSNRTKIFHG